MYVNIDQNNKFTYFRVMLGAFAAFYFANLMPYATEMYSTKGSVANPYVNSTPDFIINFISTFDSPLGIKIILGLAILISLFLAIGVMRRIAGVLLYIIHTLLFLRNNLAADVSSFYLNYMFLVCAVAGQKDAFKFSITQFKMIYQKGEPISRLFYWVLWWTASLGFFASGLIKLTNPVWRDGSAMQLILEGPLAKDNFIILFMTRLPLLSELFTYGTLLIEITMVATFFNQKLRNFSVTLIACMFVGIFLCLQLKELPLIMLIFLLLIYDPEAYAKSDSWNFIYRILPNKFLTKAQQN